MIPITSFSGLLLCALVSIGIGLHLLNIARYLAPVRYSVFAILALLMLVPIDGMIVAGYVRGVIGDPSIATVTLMILGMVKQLTRRDACDNRNASSLLFLLFLGGSLLYPLALGLTMYDPYALGYGSWPFYTALLGVAAAAWWLKLHLVVIWIVAAVSAYTFGLFESTNLWDYLLDPIAFGISIGWAVVTLISLRRESPHLERSLA